MLNSNLKWLIPVALTLVGFGTGIKSASAQSTYDFSSTYNTSVTINPFKPEFPDIVRATITGNSTDAPYGLSSFTSNTYGKVNTDPVTSITKTAFNSDPTTFGLEGEQALFDTYYGDGPNKLYGKANDSAEINPAAGTIQGGGTITIFGGAGIFQNATGKLTFTEADQLNPDPTVPSKGQAVLHFSLQVPEKVPEPTPSMALVGLGVVAIGIGGKGKRDKESQRGESVTGTQGSQCSTRVPRLVDALRAVRQRCGRVS